MTNGNNNKLYFKYVPWVVSIIFCAAIAWATIHFTTKRVNIIEPKVFKHDTEIAVIKSDLGHIKEGIDYIKERL